MDRKERVSIQGVRGSPDYDNHEWMLRTIAEIMVRDKARYFSNAEKTTTAD
jgi:hypothetical protein